MNEYEEDGWGRRRIEDDHEDDEDKKEGGLKLIKKTF